MYLLDTNIFLEILLDQEKSSECKDFLIDYYDKIFISDFSLHSTEYDTFSEEAFSTNLDFDDFYQCSVAKYYDLQIVTMDSDFKQISDIKVLFL